QGYQQQQAPPKKSKKGLLITLLAVVVVAAVAAALFLLVFNQNKKLSHTAVESYIKSQNPGASNVTCNGGKDFEMKKNGDAFTCTSSGSPSSFTVTIKNKDTGNYVVQ
ncbi:MAG: hypothetical protein QOJ37_506, partial [Pseudonocardiales bacterium]|nr:hypothetical protein [Pseudonocardiales bacterium]